MQKIKIINYDRLKKDDPLFLKAIEEIKSLGIHNSQINGQYIYDQLEEKEIISRSYE